VIAILLRALGWCDQCHLLYHKWCCVWSSWWNTESYAACCCLGDTQLDSVKLWIFLCWSTMWRLRQFCTFLNLSAFDFFMQYDTIRYDSGYLTCSKKLTGSQLSLPHLPEILMVHVQQSVTVEIGLLKSNKKTCQLSSRNLMMYVLLKWWCIVKEVLKLQASRFSLVGSDCPSVRCGKDASLSRKFLEYFLAALWVLDISEYT